MKAYSLHGVNDLVFEDLPYPETKSGWCVVRVMACGICSSDIPRIFTKGTYHFPTIPGHEFAGIVDSVADRENQTLVGKRVGVFPLIPCRECSQCAAGNYEMCSHYDYIGSRRDGAFAQYVAVPVWNLVELPENTPFPVAAMMEPLAVSLHAVKKLQIKRGESVAIVGTGMIAFAAAQWALKYGAASVTVLGRSENKRKIADTIPGISYDTISHCGAEFDAVLEAVGSNDAIDKAINCTKPGCRLVLMGNPEGDIHLRQDTYWRILRKQLTVTGTWNSSYRGSEASDWIDVRDALSTGEMKTEALISHVFPFTEMTSALELMRGHKEPYCKVMTLWNGGDRS